jgi:hypothetical protein
MVKASVPLKAGQERLGHTRPDILLKFYAHVLDASADMASSTLSRGLGVQSVILEGGVQSCFVWAYRSIGSQTAARSKVLEAKLLKGLEARAGIEPAHKGFADLSLTTWVPRLGRAAL